MSDRDRRYNQSAKGRRRTKRHESSEYRRGYRAGYKAGIRAAHAAPALTEAILARERRANRRMA